MRQRFTCEACGTRYASLGAAFFCPVCGHNSAPSTFDRTVEVVRSTIAAVPSIPVALSKVTEPADWPCTRPRRPGGPRSASRKPQGF